MDVAIELAKSYLSAGHTRHRPSPLCRVVQLVDFNLMRIRTVFGSHFKGGELEPKSDPKRFKRLGTVNIYVLLGPQT